MGTPVQPAEPLSVSPLQPGIQLFSEALEVPVPKPPLSALGRGRHRAPGLGRGSAAMSPFL